MADDGFTELEMGLNLDAAKKAAPVEVIHVPVAKIMPNPYQPRKTFEEESLLDLASSIRQYGVLQPLLVAPYKDGNYLLIAGERRLRASQMAGLTELPVIVSEYTTQQIAEVAMIENLQREDLHYLEEAEGYDKLLKEFHMTEEVVAIRVGKKQSTVANKLRLLRLSKAVRGFLKEHDLTERHARVLLKLHNEKQQLDVLDIVVKKNYNVRQTEALVERTLHGNVEVPERKKRIVIVNDVRIYLNSIKKIVTSIKDAGIPVKTQQTVENGEVVVTLRIKNTKGSKDKHSLKLF
jgi:ParB family chromosome partitioning protein